MLRGKDLNEPLVGIIKSDVILALSVAVMKNTNQEQIGREKPGSHLTHQLTFHQGKSEKELKVGTIEILTNSHTG